MVSTNRNRKAGANPTKAFFVRMITRDITFEDSILDLIDNSVDSAWQCEGSQPIELGGGPDLSAYSISITASPDRFSIIDNCGGITLDDAADRAFSFGRRPSKEHDEYSIGVYGIGMKRAIFKLGRNIHIKSTYRDTDGAKQSFAVPIDVEDWVEDDDPPWDFDIVEEEGLYENGVEIVVKQLTQGAKTSFGNPKFVRNLRRIIARDYTLHLNRGLRISVNGKAVVGVPTELLQSDEYVPARVNYEDQLGDTEVMVEIIGGMAAPPPENIDPDDNGKGDKRFGWYVACNGRIVLAADRTSVTGWGTTDWPQWHYQYSGFMGFVLFTASDAAALPLTTTKRNVEESSEIFLRARCRMRDVSKQWIAYTNAKKQAREEAKKKEKATKAVSIHDVKKRHSVALPKLVTRPPVPHANVNYSVPVTKMKKLAKEFGSIRMPYRTVGLKTFDYAYEDFVGDD